MTRQERARAVILLIEQLDAIHGVSATARGAPDGTKVRIIQHQAGWKAVVTRDRSWGDPSLIPQDRVAEAHSEELLPNLVDLWINGSKAFSCAYDDGANRLHIIRFRSG